MQLLLTGYFQPVGHQLSGCQVRRFILQDPQNSAFDNIYSWEEIGEV